MRMIRTRYALLIAVGWLALAGCGPDRAAGTGAATASAGPAETPAAAAAGGGGAGVGAGRTACDLITVDDATTALGATAGPGTPGGGVALSECIFGQGALIVGMKTDAKAVYDKARAEVVAKGQFVDLVGVGDGGFEVGRAGNATLELIKGTTIVSILLNRESGDAQAPAIALAKIAAAHL